MHETIFTLGRQTGLAIAELESLFGSDKVHPFGDSTCFVDERVPPELFRRIGGSTRAAKILTKLPNKWPDIHKHLVDNTPQHAEPINGKLTFGISTFGVKVNKKELARTALAMKKAIKASGSSVRMVPHDSLELNAATVLYNKLTSENGWELLVISNGSETFLAQTLSIQDIDDYAARDQQRPMRDAKVGMLPPKLAQILINVATKGRIDMLVLDPFCGTGVVMQEATLMDYDVFGTDIEPRMVEYTIGNLNWLDEKYPDLGDYRRIEMADATKHSWHNSDKINAVACETYLGQPLTTLPPSDQLAKIMQDANSVNHKFLQNIASQLKSGTRLCVAVPTWRGKREFLHLSVLAHLTEMGYNRVTFKHVDNKDLIYHREGQVVGRELLVLEKS